MFNLAHFTPIDVKRRDVEIVHRTGQFLVLSVREAQPLLLTEMARDCGYNVARVCQRLGISERQFRRVFADGIGMAPKEWMRQARMVTARSMLREGRAIKEVAMDLGYTTSKVFAREFNGFHEVSPTHFQRKDSSFRLRAVS
jgi:AraC-like DNA-binding protein